MAWRSAYDAAFAGAMRAVEKDVVPDALIRRGIRYLLGQRAKEVSLEITLLPWLLQPRALSFPACEMML